MIHHVIHYLVSLIVPDPVTDAHLQTLFAGITVVVTVLWLVVTRRGVHAQVEAALQVKMLGVPRAVALSPKVFDIATADRDPTTLEFINPGNGSAREVTVGLRLAARDPSTPSRCVLGAIRGVALEALAFPNMLYLGAADPRFGVAPNPLKTPLSSGAAIRIGTVTAKEKVLLVVQHPLVSKWVYDNLSGELASGSNLEVLLEWTDGLGKSRSSTTSFYLDALGPAVCKGALRWRLKVGEVGEDPEDAAAWRIDAQPAKPPPRKTRARKPSDGNPTPRTRGPRRPAARTARTSRQTTATARRRAT